MGITDIGLNVFAANVAGSSTPSHIAIGIGSLSYSGNQTVLDSETDRNQISSNDLSTPAAITLTASWNPLEISGTILKEFGVMTAGSSMVNREVLTGSLVFDGEQELQIQQTYQFYT